MVVACAAEFVGITYMHWERVFCVLLMPLRRNTFENCEHCKPALAHLSRWLGVVTVLTCDHSRFWYVFSALCHHAAGRGC